MSPPFSTYIGVFPKVFGCVCFVRIHGPAWGKVDSRALKCIFVGYSILLLKRVINVIISHHGSILSQ
jgi:hypothetical protein